MELEKQYRLSFYKECATIGDRDDIHLVQNIENKKFYVKKDLTVYHVDVYQRMMQIQDPRIPRIYECVEENGHLVVIEEYVNGDSLQTVLDNQGLLSEEQVRDYMIELCDSIAILHSQNPPIIHRDIKPSNIIISNEGNLKLIDINIAKPYMSQQSQDTILIGTKEFAAPEQYGFRQSDVRTDIYAVGVTMNYLLTGKVPREELSLGKLKPMIEKCIEMDPNNRYQSVLELKEALVNLEKNHKKKTSHQKSWRDFLPPGFRSGKLWKMLVAVISYLMIIYMSFSAELTSDGVALTGGRLYYERGMMFFMFLICIAFACDYMNVRSKIPLLKPDNIPLKRTQITLYTILVGFAWIVLGVIIEMIIFPV